MRSETSLGSAKGGQAPPPRTHPTHTTYSPILPSSGWPQALTPKHAPTLCSCYCRVPLRLPCPLSRTCQRLAHKLRFYNLEAAQLDERLRPAEPDYRLALVGGRGPEYSSQWLLCFDDKAGGWASTGLFAAVPLLWVPTCTPLGVRSPILDARPCTTWQPGRWRRWPSRPALYATAQARPVVAWYTAWAARM